MASNNATNTSNPVAFSQGGTGSALTASNGAVVYSNATGSALLAPTATASQFLLSGASSAPSWSTATFPYTVTANQLLYGSSSNVVGGLATANSSVLNTTGASALQWSTLFPGSLGGSLRLISSQTVTSTATVSFTSLTYSNYLLIINNAYPATTNGSLLLKVSTNNGSSYLATGYLAGIRVNVYNSTTLSNGSFTNLIRLSNSQNNSSSNPCNCVVFLYNVNTANNFMLDGITTFYNATPAVSTSCSLSAFAAASVNAIQILYSSGNIASATFNLYGIAVS
jgi:hypothetical protein